MGIEKETEEDQQLRREIAGVLDDCRLSHAVHPRKLKELLAIRSSSSPPSRFLPAFTRTLTPLFDLSRRTLSSERTVRFISAFAAHREEKNGAVSDDFLEGFLRFLLVASRSANKTARFRSCQIISEIIMRLPDDAEVTNEVWDDVIDCMQQRVEDKVSATRSFAVRALSRFAIDEENSDIISLFLQILPQEPSTEVRKTIVLSMPPTNATLTAIIGCTMDVSESVRRAAYCVLASKFPLQSLSIKLRTIVLQRGLADRSSSVTKECLKMLKNEWLTKLCNGDPIVLLRYLDVETYESVGETVMDALLNAGIVRVQSGQSTRNFSSSGHEANGAEATLMEAEVALYWRTLCRHLQNQAQAKGSDAATTTGAEASVYASEASANNDLLEGILPATVSDYVCLVKAHLDAGPNYRFSSRQLLLLGAMLDFSDIATRKIARTFLQELFHRPLEHEIDGDGNKVLIGDGISLGGDKDWARAVAQLAKKVHASAGEFEEELTAVVVELARPCRERSADFMQWVHCLAVTGLLLENTESIWSLQGKAIEPTELLHSLLLPGAKHLHVDVQTIATRCLCLFGLLERRLRQDVVKQLRLSFVVGPTPVSIMACKALIDLATWHGPQEVDSAIGVDAPPRASDTSRFTSINISDASDNLRTGLLDLLFSVLDRSDLTESSESDDHESIQAILGEGYAKFLLLSENNDCISTSLHPIILGRLVKLYFCHENKNLQRLKQCLSVFFEHYPALSDRHKKCVSKAFIPLMRSIWPGIYGNAGGSSAHVSKMRKQATQVARFMLQMMQTPLYAKEFMEEQSSEGGPGSLSGSGQSTVHIDSGEEGLAIRIAVEVVPVASNVHRVDMAVVSCPLKKTAAGKSYIQALCRIAVLFNFQSSEQAAIKCMRGLLARMIDSVSTDKDAARELTRMAARLRALDGDPDKEMSQEQANAILGKLEVDANIELDTSMNLPPTPATRPTRAPPIRRRARCEAASSSDDESSSPIPSVLATPSLASARSQRASKTAAMSKMSVKTQLEITDSEDEGNSSVTFEEVSDESSDALAE